MEGEKRTCRRCGGFLRADHDDDDWCDPCLELRRFYDPATDPHFLLTLLCLLQEHAGERVDPVRALGLDPKHGRTVRMRIRSLRRQGHEIHSAGERCTGYRYMGQAVVTSTRVGKPAQ